MARRGVPCMRIGCRSAAEWIAWFEDRQPILVCYRCLQFYYRAGEYWVQRPHTMPLLIGLN